jgi:ABC-2 type transport system permease protein
MKAVLAQARAEILLTLRRGESLLVTIGIPVGILAFFTWVDVLPHDGRAVDFLTPGVLALSVISSAMTSLSIATGFERHAGVLRRLATTPLGKGGLLTAKLVALLFVVVVQFVVIVGVAFLLDWHPPAGQIAYAFVIVVIGAAAFSGIGFILAGRLRAETNLAVANGLFLAFLLTGGIVVPLDRLPEGMASIARMLPAEALASALRRAFASYFTGPVTLFAIEPNRPLAVLCIWAIGTCLLAVRAFRWD